VEIKEIKIYKVSVTISVKATKDVAIDQDVKCCMCKRQDRINSTGWIYCEIYNQLVDMVKGFDETGETVGCSEYERG